jgi:DNA-binding CsgD family transcriptional regulator
VTVDAFECLLDAIYAAGEDHRQWEKVLAGLIAHLSVAGSALFQACDGSGLTLGTWIGSDPGAMQAYADYYYAADPIHWDAVPAGIVCPEHKLIQSAELERSEFYNDWMRPAKLEGTIGLTLIRNGNFEARLFIPRWLGSEPYSDEEVAFVQRLAPHLRRAVGLNQRLAALQGERRTFEAALDKLNTAVLLLNESGALCYCNPAGVELLKKHDGLIALQGRLSATDSSAQIQLAGAIRAALAPEGGRGGSVSLPRRHSARPLRVRIMPFGQRSDFWLAGPQVHAIVFVSDPDTPAARDATAEAMETYGLTPAEKSLMCELLAGRSLKEAAGRLEITPVTARNRLAHIMAKTDTHRQSELLQLMLKSSIPAR